MTTNEPNLAAEVARLQDLRTDTTTREYTIAQWLVITRLSEALAVARSGLVAADKEIRIIAADNLIEHYPLMDIARETITQIDKLTGEKDAK